MTNSLDFNEFFFLIFYLFFDNITLCTNRQNVTLSNMSHLVCITLFGETHGVTLSRLDCIASLWTIFCQCLGQLPVSNSPILNSKSHSMDAKKNHPLILA